MTGWEHADEIRDEDREQAERLINVAGTMIHAGDDMSEEGDRAVVLVSDRTGHSLAAFGYDKGVTIANDLLDAARHLFEEHGVDMVVDMVVGSSGDKHNGASEHNGADEAT
jgi:hypothetical protein